jgi:dolichol-phosphate mannosyltransferase
MLGYTLGSWAFGHVVEGWTSLSTLVLLLGSMQLILFGLLGEYVGRLYLESKRRPLFVIDEIRTGENVSASAPYYAADDRRSAPGETPN